MPPANGSSTTSAADQTAADEAAKKAAAEKAAADEAAKKAAAEKAAADEAAKKAAPSNAADDDDGLRPRRPAKVDKAKVKVLSKSKTAQVVTDGTRVWKEAVK